MLVLKWILIVILSTMAVHGEPPPPADKGSLRDLRFQLVVPSSKRHHNPENAGAFTFEFRMIPFHQIEDKLKLCQKGGFLPSYDADDPPTFHIYLPTQRYLRKYGPRLAALAKKQFASICPQVEPKIVFHVTNLLEVERFSNFVRNSIAKFSNTYPEDPEVQNYSEAMLRANEEAVAEATTAAIEADKIPEVEVEVESDLVSAARARTIRFGGATVRTVIVLGTRLAQTSSAWSEGGSRATAAFALSVGDAAIEFFTVAFTRSIQRAFRKFPPLSSNDPTWIRLQQFFNSALWNMTFFSVGRPLVMQALSHEANPEAVRAVRAEDVTSLIMYNLIGTFFYSMFNTGYETLRQKGWLSGAQIDVILQVNGLLDLATNVMSSNPAWHWMRWFTWGPQWLFYASVAAFAQIAPVRINRIVAVESSITDWERHIHDEQITDSSWLVLYPADLEEGLAKIKESQPLQFIGKFDCKALLRRVKHVVRRFKLRR